jgi:serine/threonine-protein kinase
MVETEAKTGSLAAGTAVGNSLRILSLLGVGGMGEVYEVEHLKLGRRLALKVLLPAADEDGRQRFLREARVIAGLDEEHVVSVFGCGELADGRPYLLMERLRGKTLRTLLRDAGPLSVSRAVPLIEQICSGIAAAHRQGIVHRDLKPENVFVIPHEHTPESCKILDFGIAKIPGTEATRRGSVLGTVSYMAPEQLADSATVGPEADIYSISAILFECITGTPPHSAATEHALMFKIMNERPRPLVDVCPGISEELSAVINRGLARDPSARFRDADAFRQALKPFGRFKRDLAVRGEEPTQESFSRVRPRFEQPRLRRGAVALVAAMGVVVGFVSRHLIGDSEVGRNAGAENRVPQRGTTLGSPMHQAAPSPAAEATGAAPPFVLQANSDAATTSAPSTGTKAAARSRRHAAPHPRRTPADYDRVNPYGPD